MHELGIVVKVLEQVDAVAEEYKAEKILKVTMDKLRSRAGTGSCEAYVGDELACKCQVLFMLG